jgi:hypothetical protein
MPLKTIGSQTGKHEKDKKSEERNRREIPLHFLIIPAIHFDFDCVFKQI